LVRISASRLHEGAARGVEGDRRESRQPLARLGLVGARRHQERLAWDLLDVLGDAEMARRLALRLGDPLHVLGGLAVLATMAAFLAEKLACGDRDLDALVRLRAKPLGDDMVDLKRLAGQYDVAAFAADFACGVLRAV